MAHFRVEFFKEVMGDTGHSVVAPQGAFDIDAADADAAVELAKRRFCGARRISEWFVNADRYQVENRLPKTHGHLTARPSDAWPAASG